MQDLLGPALTVGTLKMLVERCAANLQPIEDQIKEHLKQAKVFLFCFVATYFCSNNLARVFK